MSVRLYTRIATLIAVAAVAATGTSYASADSSKGVQIPANLANFREPGSTGYVPMTHVTPECRMPDGIRRRMNFFPLT